MTNKLRLVIGSDDAGFTYKEILKADLEANDLVESVVDVGVDAQGHTGYPTIAIAAAEMVAAGKGSTRGKQHRATSASNGRPWFEVLPDTGGNGSCLCSR